MRNKIHSLYKKMETRKKNIPFFFPLLLLLFLSPIAKADELPVPDLVPVMSQFRLAACVSPQEAFDKYSNRATTIRLKELGSVLCPISDNKQGWQYFFGTSIGAITSLSENSAITMFYSPWADVALICQWTNEGSGAVMSDVELITGDVLRKTKTPMLTPLWRREGEVPPQLSVLVAANDTIVAFLDTYKKRSIWNPDSWRKKLKMLKKPKQIESNREAVGALLTQTLVSMDLFFNEKSFEPLRQQMAKVRSLLLNGQTADVITMANEINDESRLILENMQLDWKRATMVSLVTNTKNAFVFVADYANPEYAACFWFKMVGDNGEPLKKPLLSRIDFVGHILSAQEVEKIATDAGMKR